MVRVLKKMLLPWAGGGHQKVCITLDKGKSKYGILIAPALPTIIIVYVATWEQKRVSGYEITNCNVTASNLKNLLY